LVELVEGAVNGSLAPPQREPFGVPWFVVPPLIIDSEVSKVFSEEASGGSLVVVVVVLLRLLGEVVLLESPARKLLSSDVGVEGELVGGIRLHNTNCIRLYLSFLTKGFIPKGKDFKANIINVFVSFQDFQSLIQTALTLPVEVVLKVHEVVSLTKVEGSINEGKTGDLFIVDYPAIGV
jgi:hypothetical protein